MKVQQISLTQTKWNIELSQINISPSIFLLFVSPEFTDIKKVLNALISKYEDATILGCSTAGEISDVTVKDQTISLTAIQLEKTTFKKVSFQVRDMNCSEKAGSEIAKNLPSSGLMFPLSMRDKENAIPVVRTILAVDEEKQSLTFAGNILQDSYVRLMKANIDRLIDGAKESAVSANELVKNDSQLAILISCVGRRLVLKQLVEEEIEVVRNVIGDKPCITGFYSYGEIAPFGEFSPCELHNQTMTITTLTEC